MSIILGVLAVVVDTWWNVLVLALVGIGAGGNGKAVGLLDLDLEEIPREDIVVARAGTTEEYFKPTDSVLVSLEDALVCDLKQGIFLTTIDYTCTRYQHVTSNLEIVVFVNEITFLEEQGNNMGGKLHTKKEQLIFQTCYYF